MKKKKRSSAFVWLAVFVIGSLSVLLFYLSDLHFRTPMYPAFGIQLPAGYSIHGIDVSHHQNAIEWEAVRGMRSKKQKIGFVFIKATEGNSMVDRHFRRNWNRSAEQSLARGAYHYFLPGRNSRSQADNFIKTVQLKKGDLPPVLDVEETGGQSSESIRSSVFEWLKLVQQHYGVRPILYTNVSFYERHLAGAMDDYPLWVAHYYYSRGPRISRNWLFWQHSERGRVNGISSMVDFNVFNGDSTAFAKLLIR